MEVQQPLINNPIPNYNYNNYPQNNVNPYPYPQQINTSPTPLPYSSNNNQNPNQNIPIEVLQYPNCSDFPEYNKVTNPDKPKIDYSKYTNINQLNHRGIIQTDSNTFYLTKKCCSKLFPILFSSFSLFLSTVIFWTEVSTATICLCVVGGIFVILGILMLCRSYISVYFILGPNNIKVVQKAWCGSKTTIYNSGQITKIIFALSMESFKNSPFMSYHVTIYQNIPGYPPEFMIFANGNKTPLYTEEEIGYFNYVVNNHIKKNMSMNNMNQV